MPKNPNRKPKPTKSGYEAMTGAMKFFLAGMVAELYLMIIRRFYLNGTAVQMIAWFDYLFYLSIVGAVVFIAGAALFTMWRKNRKKSEIGLWITIAGAFLAAASFLIWKLNAPAVTFLSVAVAAAMLLGILWTLYDRECAYALAVLGISLVALWAGRKVVSSASIGTVAKIAIVLLVLLLAGFAYLIRQAKQNNGMIGKRRLLPANANAKPIYSACAISAVALLTTLVNATLSYYAIWVLALVVFALAVYYTVKQL